MRTSLARFYFILWRSLVLFLLPLGRLSVALLWRWCLGCRWFVSPVTSVVTRGFQGWIDVQLVTLAGAGVGGGGHC